MLASALSCQRDQYDRPITGSVDFCLDGMTVPDGNEMSGRDSSGGIEGTGVDETSTVGWDTVSCYAGGDWDGGDGAGIDDGACASGGSLSTSMSTNRDGDGRVLQTTSGVELGDDSVFSGGVAVHGKGDYYYFFPLSFTGERKGRREGGGWRISWVRLPRLRGGIIHHERDAGRGGDVRS